MSSESILDLADRLWRGEASVTEHHPLQRFTELEEVADGVGFLSVMSNVTVIRTGDALALVDSGPEPTAAHVHAQVRRFSPAPLQTAVFSHGHIDHVFGIGPFDVEAADAGHPGVDVVGHEAMPARFARYRRTAGWNTAINRRQFGFDESFTWPTTYREPDTLYRDTHTVAVGDTTLTLTHARGETDDHTWTWIGERRVLCPGDLFIWAVPNAGNPQKVQRYPDEWARALREMTALGAELLLPGHGVPIAGADRVRQALEDTAALLESLVEQALALMNAGARLDEVLHGVRVPAHLLDRPYLQPVYDEPEFILHTIWRRYGGWHDGNPATLKPAPEAALASELAALAGGASRLVERARSLLADGELRLAGHLAELARLAAPDDGAVADAHGEVFAHLRDAATSTMARGVYAAAARGDGSGRVDPGVRPGGTGGARQ